MVDSTEGIRRHLVDVINSDPRGREALEAKHGKIWPEFQANGLIYKPVRDGRRCFAKELNHG